MSSPPATPRTEPDQRIAVRRIADADIDAIIAVWHETNLATYTYVDAQQKHTLDEARLFFLGQLLAQCDVWVASAIDGGATPRGVVALDEGWIRQLAVFNGWRRRGIGSRLLELAKSRLPHGIQLYTFQRNTPARRFYERHGFVAAEFGMSPPPDSEPDVLYRWTPPGV